MFDYDWFFGGPYQEQQECAHMRMVQRKFPEARPSEVQANDRMRSYRQDVEVRTLIYLRDGFSYEVKDLVTTVKSKTNLIIECEPAEELYKVGVFVVTVPFDEIARVEVFAAHRDQKPENLPMITGFRGSKRRGPDVYDGEPVVAAPGKSG
jgi:hypothetical protein